MDGIAVAADASRVLATLVRRRDETVEGLLHRADEAVGQVVRTGIPINEVQDAELILSEAIARPKRKR